MELPADRIVRIEKHREHYFGGPGNMLLPCPATVAALLKTIPEHRLMSKDLLQKRLAEQFNVQVTCPFTTKKALQAIAQDSSTQVAYWRVIKKNGELLPYFPGGLQGHATLLMQEGFTLETRGNVPKVKHFRDALMHFDSPADDPLAPFIGMFDSGEDGWIEQHDETFIAEKNEQ